MVLCSRLERLERLTERLYIAEPSSMCSVPRYTSATGAP